MTLVGPALPRPFALQFRFEREAQECPDHDDKPQHSDTRKRRRDSDRANDVGADEDLESDQNRATERASKVVVSAGDAPPDDGDRKAGERIQAADDEHSDSGQLDGFGDVRDDVLVTHQSPRVAGVHLYPTHRRTPLRADTRAREGDAGMRPPAGSKSQARAIAAAAALMNPTTRVEDRGRVARALRGLASDLAAERRRSTALEREVRQLRAALAKARRSA